MSATPLVIPPAPSLKRRLVRAGVRIVRRDAPAVDRAVRRVRAALEERYLRDARPGCNIVMDVAKFPYMGFGASIGWVHAAYVAQQVLSARLLVVNPDRWLFGGRRAEGALDRFITFPQASVVAAKEIPPDHLSFETGNWDDLRRWGYYDDLDWPHCLFGIKPAQFAELEDFRRTVFRQTYQPSAYALAAIAPMLSFLPNRYLAWHVRRGDKTAGLWKEDEPVPLADYAQATMRVLERDPAAPRQIVVCTDSEEALAEARAVAASIPGGVEVLHDPAEKRWNGYCAMHRAGEIDNVDDMVNEVLTAQKLVEILRGAAYLIGCNSSCLFRVAVLLRPDGRGITSLSENKLYKKHYPV